MRKHIKQKQQAMQPAPKPFGGLISVSGGLYADGRGKAWQYLQRRIYKRGYWVIKEQLHPLHRPAPTDLPF